MADTCSETEQPESHSRDTGEEERPESSSETGEVDANGVTACQPTSSLHNSPKSNPFQGVRPAKFIPGMNVTGSNPFSARPSLKSDVVTTTGSESSPAKFVLRPSALSGHVQNSVQKAFVLPSEEEGSSSLLKPAKLPDPTKSHHHSDEEDNVGKENKDSSPGKDRLRDVPDSQSDHTTEKTENLFAAALDKNERLPDSSTSPSSNDKAAGDNILGQNLTERVTGVQGVQTSPKTAVSSTGFVFGENLADRVIVQSERDGENNSDEEDHASPDSTEQTTPEKAQTLEESAREYQATHDRKTELQEVEVVTGEENESNVLQANGKLFVFDGGQEQWIERGRGLFRLNDMRSLTSSQFQSRLVMRTQGSLRLILNTKIWPGMTVERASQKSVRLTATDGDEGVKIFLLMTNPKDNENILRALDWRIQQLRVQDEASSKDNQKVAEKRKAEPESPTEEFVPKKTKKTDDDSSIGASRREESDSSVLDPETEASSESHASSFTLRTDSD